MPSAGRDPKGRGSKRKPEWKTSAICSTSSTAWWLLPPARLLLRFRSRLRRHGSFRRPEIRVLRRYFLRDVAHFGIERQQECLGARDHLSRAFEQRHHLVHA